MTELTPLKGPLHPSKQREGHKNPLRGDILWEIIRDKPIWPLNTEKHGQTSVLCCCQLHITLA